MGPLPGRHTTDVERDVVVFLIGMRINRPRQVRRWWPVLVAMPRMLKELEADPSLGLLSAHPGLLFGGPGVVQYWRSFEQLEAYARNPDARHLPAWREFNRRARGTTAVGIYHETYRLRAGGYEAVYVDMPAIGLAASGGLRPVGSTSTAASRLGLRAEERAEEQPV